jgi:hypothetical protein
MDLEYLNRHEHLNALKPGLTGFIPRVHVLRQDRARQSGDGPYGGFCPGEPLGALVAERRLGKGSIWLCTVPLVASLEEPGTGVLWQALAAHFGVGMSYFAARSEMSLVSRHSVAPRLEGDLRHWTNEETDANVAPWSRAQPVAMDESQRIPRPKGPGERGALFYLLHDETYFYVAARVFAPSFDFESVATDLYEKDSIEIRVDEHYILASRGPDGKIFIHTIHLPEEAAAQITGTVRVGPRGPAHPDEGLLSLSTQATQECFYELRIPRDIFPTGLGIPQPMGLAVNAATQEIPRRLQLTFPPRYKWQDPTTFATLELKGTKDAN